MIEHHYKVWGGYYDKLLSGEKTFEVRSEDDVDHKTSEMSAGDTAVFTETNEETGEPTGRKMRMTITYVLHGLGSYTALPDDVLVFSVKDPIALPEYIV